MDILTEKLLAFLDAIPSPCHTAHVLARRLEEEGYLPLLEKDAWHLRPLGKYYVRRGGALLAFRLPKKAPECAMIGAAHGDFPTFRVKPCADERRGGGLWGLSVEKYGGMLCAPWMDRPLSLAGQAVIRTEGGIETRPVSIDRDLCIIPSVAIHMNRDANQNASYNAARDMIPLWGTEAAKGALPRLLSEALGVGEEDILSHDLFLYPRAKATVLGAEGELIAAPHLDDTACVFALTEGFLAAPAAESLPILAVFDNEEVGSSTKQGANSTLLDSVLRRIMESYGLGETAVDRMLAESFLVSADNAHAVHPNHPEYADANHAPILGGGVAIKYNASQRYATDGISAALFAEFCRRANAPFQRYANRADLPGGSTLGSICTTRVGLTAVDVGLPQLAMHSCFETAAIADTASLVLAMMEIYSSRLEGEGGNFRIVKKEEAKA